MIERVAQGKRKEGRGQGGERVVEGVTNGNVQDGLGYCVVERAIKQCAESKESEAWREEVGGKWLVERVRKGEVGEVGRQGLERRLYGDRRAVFHR